VINSFVPISYILPYYGGIPWSEYDSTASQTYRAQVDMLAQILQMIRLSGPET